MFRDVEIFHSPGSQVLGGASGSSPVAIDVGVSDTTQNSIPSFIIFDRYYVHEDVPDTGPVVNSAAVTNIALTSNVVTVTAANTFNPGSIVSLTKLTTATYLNNQILTVQSASPTAFTAAFTHANDPSHADTGFATSSTNSTPNAFKFNCANCALMNGYVDQILRPGNEGHIAATTDGGTGPLKVNHNWWEGESSSLFLGGAVPQIVNSVAVCNLEVRRNRLSYPASWLGLTAPQFQGAALSMVRKNGGEIKTGCQLLYDGNITENVDNSMYRRNKIPFQAINYEFENFCFPTSRILS